MSSGPTLETRPVQHYAAIRCHASMDDVGLVAPPLIGQVAEWLDQRHVTPSGPPFFNYVLIGSTQLDVDVGFPVPCPLEGDARVRPGRFPEGRYAVLRHVGPYDGLKHAHARLYAWGKERGLRWQGLDRAQGTECLARFESYLTDPATEQHPNRLETAVVFLIEGAVT